MGFRIFRILAVVDAGRPLDSLLWKRLQHQQWKATNTIPWAPATQALGGVQHPWARRFHHEGCDFFTLRPAQACVRHHIHTACAMSCQCQQMRSCGTMFMIGFVYLFAHFAYSQWGICICTHGTLIWGSCSWRASGKLPCSLDGAGLT